MADLSPTGRDMSGRVWVRAAAAGACAAAAGCVAEDQAGSASTFRFEAWVPAAWFAAGAAAAAVAVLVLRPRRLLRRGRVGYVAYGFAVACWALPAATGLNLWCDRVVIDDDHFEFGSGLVPVPRASFRFAEVTEVGLAKETTDDRDGRATTATYVFVVTGSGRHRLRAGEVIQTREASGRLGRAARERGIRVVGLP